MSILREASRYLSTAVENTAGLSVQYVRGELSQTVTAAVGSTLAQLDAELGVLETTPVDFLITTTAFRALRLNTDVPERGDKIIHSDDHGTWEYEIGAMEGSEPPFRYTDAHHHQLRVHTVRIRQVR